MLLPLQGLTALQSVTASSITEAQQHFAAAQNELRTARQSAPEQVSGPGQDPGTLGACDRSDPRPGADLGFEASVNWSMLGPAPPRTVPHVSSTEAWQHTEQLLQHLLGTFEVLQVSL